MLLWAALALAEDLRVTANVQNGTIYVDGADAGVRTPGTIVGLDPGWHKVRVVQGCRVGTADVEVPRGGTGNVSVNTAVLDGMLSVYPQPIDARVSVDGVPLAGPAGIPVKLACGEHTVAVSAPKYASESLTAMVAPGEPTIFPVTLRKLALGSVEVAVTPATATILLDGKPVGTNVVLLPAVTEGVHTIGAELGGKKSVIEQILVKPEAELAYDVNLVRRGGRRKSTVTPFGDASVEAVNEADAEEAEER